MRVYVDGAVVVKEAMDAIEAGRLGREAEALRVLAHPGVISVAAFEADLPPPATARLALHKVDGTAADRLPLQPPELAAGWAAALATTVADLHDLGYTHGALTADHVIVDRSGRPVLCGFSAASASSDPQAHRVAVRDDVSQLACLVGEWLPARVDPARRGLDRRLDRLSEPGRRDPSARELAEAVLEAVPAARLGPPCDEGGGPATNDLIGTSRTSASTPTSGRSWKAMTLSAAVLAAVFAVAAGALGSWISSAGPHPSAGRPSLASPRPARGPASPVEMGVYRLDPSPGQDPVTVLGRWECGPATPATLDLRSGTVWVFNVWPAPGRAAVGVQVGKVPGAVGIAAEAGKAGCDRLLVLRTGGRSEALPVRGTGG